MAVYLTMELFKDLTILPESFVDEVEAEHAGWVDKQLDRQSRWIDSRLRKRYASPFAAHDASPPTPVSVQGWLADIVTLMVLLKRGVDANDEQYDTIRERYLEAKAEIQEAADAEKGLFDLPARVDEDASAIARQDTRSYSEQSPYVGHDVQAEIGRDEDSAGEGSHV